MKKKTADELFHSIRERGHGKPHCLLASATVLHAGWEMDNEAWVVEMADGSRIAFCTNHGGLYPMDDEFLIEKIAETQSSMEQLNELRRLLT